MSPKPLFEWLLDAFRLRWATRATVAADARGQAAVDAWYGDHVVEGRTESGHVLHGSSAFRSGDPQSLPVVLG